MNWLLETMRFRHSVPWFGPLPPPPLLRPPHVFFHHHIPLQHHHQLFTNFMHPAIDQLAISLNDENPMDYYNLYPNQLAIENSHPVVDSKTYDRKYETLNCLGIGGFGKAFNARRRSDNRSVVLKFLPKESILNWATEDNGKRIPYEIDILYRLRGVSGVIRIFEHFEEIDSYVFAMEKIPNSCTLLNFVMNHSSLANTELLRHIFRELVQINLTLEAYGVWHRDCKPENILYCKNDRSIRFIDFGSAAPAQEGDYNEFQGTLEIMTPEWILQKRYSGEKSCVWALGVCLYFLLFQQYPFRSKVAIVNGRSHLPFPSSPDNDAYQTMKLCLHGNEYRRPKLNSLLNLSWLTDGYSS